MKNEQKESYDPDSKKDTGEYIAPYDASKIVAAFAVIWIHSALNVNSSLSDDPSFLGRFGLSFFVIGSVYFTAMSVIKEPALTFINYAFKRFRRVYLLFFVWSGIYLALKYLECAIFGGVVTLEISPQIFFFIGGAYHLWFLPFIFIVNLFTYILIKGVSRTPDNINFICIFFVAIGLFVTQKRSFMPASFINQPTIYNWWFSLPGVFWAMAYTLHSASTFRNRSTRFDAMSVIYRTVSTKIAAIIALLLCTLATGFGFFYGQRSLLANLAGLCFIIASMSGLKNTFIERIAVFGKLSYGIYLTHLIFVGFGRVIAYKVGGSDTTWMFAVLNAGFSFIGASVSVFFLTKWRNTAWLVKRNWLGNELGA